jgi:hypothetical protein
MSYRRGLLLRYLRWLGTLPCVLTTAALRPTCCAVILHDWRAVATSTAVETALLADSARVLVGLIVAGPAIEVERRLYVGLFVWWLGDGGFERIQVCVLHEGIA